MFRRTFAMPLRLRHDLHWCNCLGRAVFLDLAADRYFCLTSILNNAFLRLATGEPQSDDSRPLAALCERGILLDDPSAPQVLPHPMVEAVAHDQMTVRSPGANAWQIVRTLAAEARLGRALQTQPLGKLIEAARLRRPSKWRVPSDPGKALDAIVAAANQTAFLTRQHDRCLVRGFAVHAACKRQGIHAKLVFGVIANPFAAHCWVQLGSAVLVGSFDQARLYTPILVVE